MTISTALISTMVSLECHMNTDDFHLGGPGTVRSFVHRPLKALINFIYAIFPILNAQGDTQQLVVIPFIECYFFLLLSSLFLRCEYGSVQPGLFVQYSGSNLFLGSAWAALTGHGFSLSQCQP